jgi:hypothetical protein
LFRFRVAVLIAPVYGTQALDDPTELLKTLQPNGKIVDAKDIAETVLYLMQGGQVTGEILRLNGGSHAGRRQAQDSPIHPGRSGVK